jgi:hypothetical protein
VASGSPVITFLSDYGYEDGFAGICHGVMAGICPGARIIDLTHGIGRHDVRAGALILHDSLPYTPVGVHLAVVDPDVGAERRAVALRLADDRRLVGPDNGLLSLAAQAGGGVVEAADIAHSRYRLEPVSATFHGRDIFAPVAAQLASGVPVPGVGEPCDPDELVELELPEPRLLPDGVLVAHATYIDHFGNVQLNVGHEQLAAAGLRLGQELDIQVGSGTTYQAHFVRTFADGAPDELLLYEDASRRLALAVSYGDAARRLGLTLDDKLWISAR